MNPFNRLEALVLFLGDILCWSVALWVALFLRHFTTPETSVFIQHAQPFSILFLAWALVFFIVGLYERHTVVLKRRLPALIIQAQVVNTLVAAVFFFLIPYFGITPKTVLAIHLAVAASMVIVWRLYIFWFFSGGKKMAALFVGGGSEFKELLHEVNNNNRYRIEFTHVINVDELKDGGVLSDKIFHELRNPDIRVAVINTKHRKIEAILPHLYKPLYSNVEFVDANKLYEDIFARVPLSSIDSIDGLSPTGLRVRYGYDIAKRVFDVLVSLCLGILSLVMYPFVALIIKLEGAGPIFIVQDRVGENMARVRLYKFRTMTHADSGKWIGTENNTNKVTRVGLWLRRLRIDELPQLWNVLRGDLSLVGPRPDIVGLYKDLAESIPFYNLRYSVRPGLSGWAQVRQVYEKGNISPQSVAETRTRLQYDLYYVKNRSLFLDMTIALQTLKIFMTKLGS